MARPSKSVWEGVAEVGFLTPIERPNKMAAAASGDLPISWSIRFHLDRARFTRISQSNINGSSRATV
jgi:hypothetical protein